MSFSLEITSNFEKDIKKLSKNYNLIKELEKKTIEISENPTHYKPLRNPLQGYFRIHLLSCYVLVFTYSLENQIVIFVRLSHHDDVYKKPI